MRTRTTGKMLATSMIAAAGAVPVAIALSAVAAADPAPAAPAPVVPGTPLVNELAQAPVQALSGVTQALTSGAPAAAPGGVFRVMVNERARVRSQSNNVASQKLQN